MAKTIHLVFNPVAGQGNPEAQLQQLRTCLGEASCLTVHQTSEEIDAKQLAAKALEAGADVVVAAGGDGTVSAAAAALIHTDIPLGIVPLGTANSFAGAQNIPGDIAAACDVILQGQPHRFDTSRCGDRILLLNVCIGFEADLLTQISRQDKSRYGRLALVASGLRQWQRLKRFNAEIQLPQETHSTRATAITVANAASAQSMLAQGPAVVKADDQLLAITVASPDHRWGAIATAIDLFISALQNRAVQRDSVQYWKAERVTVTTDPPQRVLIDGEPNGRTPITVECLPQSLMVMVPPQR